MFGYSERASTVTDRNGYFEFDELPDKESDEEYLLTTDGDEFHFGRSLGTDLLFENDIYLNPGGRVIGGLADMNITKNNEYSILIKERNDGYFHNDYGTLNNAVISGADPSGQFKSWLLESGSYKFKVLSSSFLPSAWFYFNITNNRYTNMSPEWDPVPGNISLNVQLNFTHPNNDNPDIPVFIYKDDILVSGGISWKNEINIILEGYGNYTLRAELPGDWIYEGSTTVSVIDRYNSCVLNINDYSADSD